MDELTIILITWAIYLCLKGFFFEMLMWIRYLIAFGFTWFIFNSVLVETHPLFNMLYMVSPFIVLFYEGIRGYFILKDKNI